MKKPIVLFILFALPILAYLFFASGVNTFAKLPTVTAGVNELPDWQTLSGQTVKLRDKITILGFPGKQVLHNKGNAFNLQQKIYNKNKSFTDFQVVMIVPVGKEKEVEQLVQELSVISDMANWYFVFAKDEEIESYYKSLNLVGGLDSDLGTPNVFIIDKDLNLRGRKGRNKEDKEEYKEGYNTISAADLHNEMSDDVKVILAEYRLALKKNNKRKI